MLRWLPRVPKKRELSEIGVDSGFRNGTLVLIRIMSAHATGDETADFFLRQLRFLSRVGSPRQKADVRKWERIFREHAEPAEEPSAVNFATARTADSEAKPE